jgi:hypothetical protein
MSKTRSIHRQPQGPAKQIEQVTRLVRKTVVDAMVRASLASGTDQPPLRVVRAAQANAPAQMAAEQAADPSAREQLTASYERCLASYRAFQQTQGGEPDLDDVGRAVAFFIGVNLHVLHGVEADADMLQALEPQVRGIARARSNWDAASIAERQAFFERIAIVSVVVSGSWAGAAAHGPAGIDNVQCAARQYLEQMMGLNPDFLTLGPTGLTARHDANRATAEQAA